MSWKQSGMSLSTEAQRKLHLLLPKSISNVDLSDQRTLFHFRWAQRSQRTQLHFCCCASYDRILLAFVNATVWRWFSDLFLPCRILMVFNAVTSEGIAGHKHSVVFFRPWTLHTEIFPDSPAVDGENPKFHENECWEMRNILKLLDYLPRQFSQRSEPLFILVCKGLSLLRMHLSYTIMTLPLNSFLWNGVVFSSHGI